MRRILLLGASGYVGGRLRVELERKGERIRCLSRRPDFLRCDSCEVIQGDVQDVAALQEAFRDVDIAYYLVRSLGSPLQSRREALRGARNVSKVLRESRVRKVIYLGSLGHRTGFLNQQKARIEIGDILRQSGVPVLEFRTSAILGSGSFLFEIVKALAERLPVMLAPSWTAKKLQPIAIEDVISYLLLALDVRLEKSRIVEIGGPDSVSFVGLLGEYGRQKKLTRLVVPLPFAALGLSSLWLALFAPVPARVIRKLVEDLNQQPPVDLAPADELFHISPRGYQTAISRALVHEGRSYPETRWSGALSSSAGWQQRQEEDLQGSGNRLSYSQEVQVPFSPHLVFRSVQRIGGDTGWYCSDWLWRLRGLLDLLAGGVGVRRGRRHPIELRPGDVLDFWRVEAIEPGRQLLLLAEMRVPGRAWLQFKVNGNGIACSTLRLTAFFEPVGWKGRLYWDVLYPVHVLLFRGMLRNMVRQIEGTSPSSV